MLERREGVVVAKEQAALERLQENEMLLCLPYLKKYRNYPPALVDFTPTNSSPKNSVEHGSDITVIKSDKSDQYDEATVESNYLDEKPHSLLAELCEKMDVEQLQKYTSDNRKNLASICEEIPISLKAASNPFSQVLDSLKNFYSGEIIGSDGKKDARTYLLLMESLSSLIMNSETLSNEQKLTDEIKERAKAVADYWKPKLDSLDIYASSGNSLEAHALLQR